jgi:hypothetical protein
MMARKKLPPNDLLCDVRLSRLSPSGSGRPMSRQELAEQVNAYLWKQHKRRTNLDENDIGLLERGDNRWPGKLRREAFRNILDAATDAELGFYINRRPRAGVVRTLPELPASVGARLPEQAEPRRFVTLAAVPAANSDEAPVLATRRQSMLLLGVATVAAALGLRGSETGPRRQIGRNDLSQGAMF